MFRSLLVVAILLVMLVAYGQAQQRDETSNRQFNESRR